MIPESILPHYLEYLKQFGTVVGPDYNARLIVGDKEISATHTKYVKLYFYNLYQNKPELLVPEFTDAIVSYQLDALNPIDDICNFLITLPSTVLGRENVVKVHEYLVARQEPNIDNFFYQIIEAHYKEKTVPSYIVSFLSRLYDTNAEMITKYRAFMPNFMPEDPIAIEYPYSYTLRIDVNKIKQHFYYHITSYKKQATKELDMYAHIIGREFTLIDVAPYKGFDYRANFFHTKPIDDALIRDTYKAFLIYRKTNTDTDITSAQMESWLEQHALDTQLKNVEKTNKFKV